MNGVVRNERKLLIFFATHSHLTKFKAFYTCKKVAVLSRELQSIGLHAAMDSAEKSPTATTSIKMKDIAKKASITERSKKKIVTRKERQRKNGCLSLNQIFYECDKFTRLNMQCR